jgi:phosphoglycolate phosphatase
MAISTVLCDLDGTLIDSQHDIALAFQYALQHVVGNPPPTAAAIAQHIGKPLAEMLQALGHTLPGPYLQTFLHIYRQTYAGCGMPWTHPYPGVVDTLQTLSSMPLAVVTTKLQEQAESILQQLHLAPFFRYIQGGTTGLRLKPAPDTVVAALAALGSAPAQALMVGDTPADILAGKAAGTKTCAVTYGYGTRQALVGCQPDFLIERFSDLLGIVSGTVQHASS